MTYALSDIDANLHTPLWQVALGILAVILLACVALAAFGLIGSVLGAFLRHLSEDQLPARAAATLAIRGPWLQLVQFHRQGQARLAALNARETAAELALARAASMNRHPAGKRTAAKGRHPAGTRRLRLLRTRGVA